MNLAISVGGYAHYDLVTQTDYVLQAEKMGINTVWSAEGWGEDAVTSLAYLAALTNRVKLGTGIMQISARVPAITAMTALSMANLSGDRFLLGLGTSGPQVVEGLHGVKYDKPLTRLKETVEIVRLAAKGYKIDYSGKVHKLPLPNGPGKAIRLSSPSRSLPIYLATIAPQALRYTGRVADGWLGAAFSPDHPDAQLKYLIEGAKEAGRSIADIDLHMPCYLAIGRDVARLIEERRPDVAFSLGAMGSAEVNFYNAAYRRAGFEQEAKLVQDLWLSGKKKEAIAAVTDNMVTDFAAIGTIEMVKERLQKYKDVGINTLVLRFPRSLDDNRLRIIEKTFDIIDSLA